MKCQPLFGNKDESSTEMSEKLQCQRSVRGHQVLNTLNYGPSLCDAGYKKSAEGFLMAQTVVFKLFHDFDWGAFSRLNKMVL